MENWVDIKPDHSASRRAAWLGALAGVAVALGVVWVWDTIRHRAHEHIEAAADFTARINEALIVQDLEHRLSALDRLAGQSSADGEAQDKKWEADARHYMRDMPGVEWILRTDASLQTDALVFGSVDGSLAAGATGNWRSAAAALAAGKGGDVALTPPFAQGGDRLKIAAVLPIMSVDRFGGVIVAAMDLRTWLSAVVANPQDADQNVRIMINDQEVFRQMGATDTTAESQPYSRQFVNRGLSWTMLIAPTYSFLSAGHGDSSTLVLIVGLMFSLLAAIVVFLALNAHAQSSRFQEVATRLAALFRNLPGMAYRGRVTPGRPMDVVSPGCRALSGYSREELEERGLTWDDLISPVDGQRVEREIRRAIEANSPYELEYRIVTKGGDERWMWERGRADSVCSDRGLHIEGFISDITARRQAEQAVLEARAFSEAVLETAAEAVITIDSGGKIEKFNRAAEQMFMYSRDEVHGKNIRLLMPQNIAAQHDNFITRYLETGVPKILGSGRELTAKRRDGSAFPIFLSVSEVLDRSERKFVGILRDISAQRAAENEARRYREDLAHVDRLDMLGEMATGIAHEINQPLTAISLFVQAGSRLLDADKLERMPEIFDKLDQHAHRASAVIERMQAMARRRESAKEITDCNSLLMDVAKLAEAEARFRDMSIELDVADSLPPVEADVIQIQQVVLNLIRNGMEATQSVNSSNGSSIVLRTGLDSVGRVKISVVDRGCGISEEVAEHLFTPFATTKKSGMGLGLSISRAIIVAHGGQLDFHNNHFGGATFQFTLPPADAEYLRGYAANRLYRR